MIWVNLSYFVKKHRGPLGGAFHIFAAHALAQDMPIPSALTSTLDTNWVGRVALGVHRRPP